MNRSSPPLAVVVLAVLLAAGCMARRTEPLAPPLEFTDPQLVRGREVFYAQCHYCHPHGAAGLGPAIVNKPLPSFMIKLQVRHGLGAMPSIKEDRVPAADLDALVAYIKEVHANKPRS